MTSEDKANLLTDTLQNKCQPLPEACRVDVNEACSQQMNISSDTRLIPASPPPRTEVASPTHPSEKFDLGREAS